MAVTRPTYAAAAAITITLVNLANSTTAARASTAVDNSTTLYDDALVSLTVKPLTGTPAAGAAVYVYLYALSDGGAYTDSVTGTDAAFTLPSTPNVVLGRVLPITVSAATVVSLPFSVALCFGGTMPQKWGLAVLNSSGFALDAAIGSASYIGVTYTTV